MLSKEGLERRVSRGSGKMAVLAGLLMLAAVPAGAQDGTGGLFEWRGRGAEARHLSPDDTPGLFEHGRRRDGSAGYVILDRTGRPVGTVDRTDGLSGGLSGIFVPDRYARLFDPDPRDRRDRLGDLFPHRPFDPFDRSFGGDRFGRGIFDDFVVRDRRGRAVYTIEPRTGGRFVIRDRDGRRVGRIVPR
ncbi:MAG TPA: hypothetical protein VEY95_04665 [Azospirillaceae bacterium]|nr:hypothetical protein [Azospirillaceae bacterium]